MRVPFFSGASTLSMIQSQGAPDGTFIEQDTYLFRDLTGFAFYNFDPAATDAHSPPEVIKPTAVTGDGRFLRSGYLGVADFDKLTNKPLTLTPSVHAYDVHSGSVPFAALPTGTSAVEAAIGDHTHAAAGGLVDYQWLSCSTAEGLHSFTGIGFQPTAIMTVFKSNIAETGGNSSGIGMASSSLDGRNVVSFHNTGSAPAGYQEYYYRTDNLMYHYDDTGGILKVNLSSFNATGFTLNVTTNISYAQSTIAFMAMCFG